MQCSTLKRKLNFIKNNIFQTFIFGSFTNYENVSSLYFAFSDEINKSMLYGDFFKTPGSVQVLQCFNN